MKNYQYLTDGLLESYALGALSPENRKEAVQLIATDPDLAPELEALEMEMEHHFMQYAVPPPPAIKTALQQRLIGAEVQKWQAPHEPPYTKEAPRSEPTRSPYVEVEVNDTYLRVHKNWRTALIAIFILSKVFLAFGLYHYFKASSLEQEIERLKATQQVTAPIFR